MWLRTTILDKKNGLTRKVYVLQSVELLCDAQHQQISSLIDLSHLSDDWAKEVRTILIRSPHLLYARMEVSPYHRLLQHMATKTSEEIRIARIKKTVNHGKISRVCDCHLQGRHCNRIPKRQERQRWTNPNRNS